MTDTLLPETILQFGTGRFLRAFTDRFVDQANQRGEAVGRIVVVQSTSSSRAEVLQRQASYHVVVRGYEHGQLIERSERVDSLSRVLRADTDWAQVLEVARAPALKYIVSNTTEAGYAVDPADELHSAPPVSFPAKLAAVLLARYDVGQSPVVILPCELIERNADKLRDLVCDLAENWDAPEAAIHWIRDRCVWLCNLVDCIVTPVSGEHPLLATDPAVIQAEPYTLWAIERHPGLSTPLFTHPAIQFVDELAPYYLRKVRILNGLHTAMVGQFLPQGFKTVQEVLADRAATKWVRALLYEEIVPTLVAHVDGVAEFADETFDRLRNPYLTHKLSDITLNHAAKVQVRLLPTRNEYERLYGRPPQKLTTALAWQPAS